MTEPITAYIPAQIEVRSLAKREVDMRIMPWDTQIETEIGPEEFARGAFEGTDVTKIRLMGMEHEIHLGVGQTGNPTITRRPIGKALAIEDRDDGAYATFRVSSTGPGDEYLALAMDGVVDGVSAEFTPIPGGSEFVTRNGRRVRRHNRVRLTAVSPTYRPAYEDARVVAFRSEQQESSVTDKNEQPDPQPDPEPPKEPDAPVPAQARSDAKVISFMEKVDDRLARMEEQARSAFQVPSVPGEDHPQATLGQWASVALRALAGERLADNDPQYRLVAELITTDNLGVVPHAHMTELIGVIDASRPFMATTRRLETPSSGMDIVVPKITTRPTTAVQAGEKDELSSTATSITSETFSAVTVGGTGDISLQLLRRSSPSYLSLYLELLAEAMAIDAEDLALRALFNEMGGGVTAASSMDPNDLQLGAAYQTSFNAVRRAPDTIWLSTEAVGEFIDAQASGTNAPLYSNLNANITAAGGLSGTISGLRAVHVPALDTHGAFALVGPSSGFAWAEDGAFTLQVDVPSKAGRDVALVSIFWFAPWYPDAFTAYNVAS